MVNKYQQRFKTTNEKFDEKVMPITETGCLIWLGCTKGHPKHPQNHYGNFQLNYKYISAHRFAWERENGKIPDGLQVLHKCDIPLCVNPTHMYLGTAKENMADRDRKGRDRFSRVKAASLGIVIPPPNHDLPEGMK